MIWVKGSERFGRKKAPRSFRTEGPFPDRARGATEDQAAAAVKLEQYEKMPNYPAQREVTVRRMYKDLTWTLP